MKIAKERRGSKYLKIAIVLLILVAMVLGGLYYLWKQNQKVEVVPTFDGVVACLPLKSLTSEAAEEDGAIACQKGLMDKNGSYFALQDVAQNKLKEGEKITVHGNLEPVTEETDGDYAISGVISGK